MKPQLLIQPTNITIIKENTMLVELRDVEVYIQPDEILIKAIDEGDLTIDQIIQTCRVEEGVESILDAVDNDDILHYVQEYDLDIEINM